MEKYCRDCGSREFIMEATIIAEAKCDGNGNFICWTTLEAGLDRPEFSEIKECSNCGSTSIMTLPKLPDNREFIKIDSNKCPECNCTDQEIFGTKVLNSNTVSVKMKCSKCWFEYEKLFDFTGWGIVDKVDIEDIA